MTRVGWVLRGSIGVCAILAPFLSAQSLRASQLVLIDFSFSGSGVTASGAFTATYESGDTYLVTEISGTQNGLSMNLLAPDAFSDNDNTVNSSAPFLDDPGISFSIGSENYNIFYYPPGGHYFECESVANSDCSTGNLRLTSFTASVAPEPANFLLIAMGVLSLGGASLLRRKVIPI
jgi:hypothetical protein